VHNGIEYGDMQLICEAYHILRDLCGLSSDEMHQVFSSWNQGELNSYLIEITADILGYRTDRVKPWSKNPGYCRAKRNRQVDGN